MDIFLSESIIAHLEPPVLFCHPHLTNFCDALYYGIKTGLNEAFVVDRATRDRLIAEHPSSAEVLKPYLRGRDVKRWRVDSQDLWLIFTRRGIAINKYPAIKKYLSAFKDALTPGVPGGRKPGSYKWYEIQDNIAYWQEFEKPKILYQEIATYQAFTWDNSGAYCNNKVFFITDVSIYLLALLNARTTWFFLGNVASKLQGNAFALQTPYVNQVPIPTNEIAQVAIEKITNQILTAKANDPAADVSAWEAEIDQMVYVLYGLSEDEIRIVEGRQ